MQENNKQPNNKEEVIQVVEYFKKLGYKPVANTEEKILELMKDYPDRDFVRGAREMYEWFDERKKYGRQIKSFHATFRNWMKKEYAPKKEKSNDFWDQSLY